MAMFGAMTGAGNFTGWPAPGSVGRNLLEQDPDSAFQRLMEQQGLSFRQDPYARWARQQADTSYRLYKARASTDPSLDYVDWLDEFGPQLSPTWQALPAQARGLKNPGGLGRVNWSGF